MPSVRYAPTGKFSQHSSGIKLERTRFIIIDDDSNSVFCPRNLSAHFGNSEKFKRYRFPQPCLEGGDEVLTGVKRIDSPVAPDILINGLSCTNNVKAKGSYLHTSADADKDGVGRQEQNEGKKLLMKVHSYYHQSQVSNIAKFVCWSHGPTGGYTPEIALLFKQGTYSTTKFDWQESPNAAVFMCNDQGGVDKLLFGDKTVSGLEFVSLGEPIGNYATAIGDESSYISLIPGSDRAEQICDTLMERDAKGIQKSRWDAGSAIISSSQSTDDGDYLMMKSTKKTSWNNRGTRQINSNDIGAEFKTSAGLSSKQLIGTRASDQAETTNTTSSPHRTLTWLPSKIPTQMANKVASFFPGTLSKGAKEMEVKDSPLVVTSARVPFKAITTSVGKPHIDEPNKFKKVRERLPRLSRVHPTHTIPEKRSTRTRIGFGDPETVVSRAGNDISERFYNKKMDGRVLIGETKDHEKLKGFEKMRGNVCIPKLIADGRPSACDTIYNISDYKTLVSSDKLEAPKTIQVAGHHKNSLLGVEPCASKFGLLGSGSTYILGEKKHVSPSDIHSSKFDLSGLPRTCVRTSDLSTCTRSAIISAIPMTPPDTPVDDYPIAEDPVFGGCKVQRGFSPIYPTGITPKTDFENRVGGLDNWYQYPMVQVAREYLPEGMKDTDWSWTDNDVSGEFIPGGIAW